MDPVKNPYAPGAGTRPPELAGRKDIIDSAEIAFKRVAIGRPERSMIMVGLRGVGKTVLLNEIEQLAEDNGFLAVSVEAHEGKALPDLLAPFFRTALYKLSKVESAKELSRKGLRILKSFFNSVKIQFNELEVGLSIEAETGTADSGDLEADLPDLFLALGKAAKAAGKPLAILIDELQYLSTEEFSALIMAIHKVNQNNLPLILVGAGLPQILGLAGNSKSYAERLFRYPEIGALSDEDAIGAIVNPAKQNDVIYTDGAVRGLLDITQKYPYFIQQWAYESWNHSQGPQISEMDVTDSTPKALAELDVSFFKVRFDRCTPSEKKYMRALADFGDGDHRSGDIAEKLGVKSKSVAPTRSSLIKKGMIYSPSHGDTAFTVPMFHEYMVRVMPVFDK
jgi:AAA+ ATPase superfamily predicted ATPase